MKQKMSLKAMAAKGLVVLGTTALGVIASLFIQEKPDVIEAETGDIVDAEVHEENEEVTEVTEG